MESECNGTEQRDEKAAQNYFYELQFRNQEEGVQHNPYNQEVREMLSIEHGDAEQLTLSLKEVNQGTLGKLSNNPLRNAKNLGIVVITLASRAAIRGGLEPEVAFSLSDSYIMQVENCHDTDSVYTLVRKAEYKYTSLVHEVRTKNMQHNAVIDECRNYIITHLHEKIAVADLASHTGLSANYISELFRSYAHSTVTDYILNEKVKAAKNLLLYSELSAAEIAFHLGFASQSHFGERFKKLTGQTPREYRSLYGNSYKKH